MDTEIWKISKGKTIVVLFFTNILAPQLHMIKVCLTGCKTEVILSSLNIFNSNSTCRDYLEDKTLATNLVNH